MNVVDNDRNLLNPAIHRYERRRFVAMCPSIAPILSAALADVLKCLFVFLDE